MTIVYVANELSNIGDPLKVQYYPLKIPLGNTYTADSRMLKGDKNSLRDICII